MLEMNAAAWAAAGEASKAAKEAKQKKKRGWVYPEDAISEEGEWEGVVVAGAGGGRGGGEAGRMNRKAKRAAMQAQMLLKLEESVKREAAAWKREREASFPRGPHTPDVMYRGSASGRRQLSGRQGSQYSSSGWEGGSSGHARAARKSRSVVGPEATVEEAQASLAALFVSCGTVGGDEEDASRVRLGEPSAGGLAALGTPTASFNGAAGVRPASGRHGVQEPGSASGRGGRGDGEVSRGGRKGKEKEKDKRARQGQGGGREARRGGESAGFAEFEAHTTGFASRMMAKMGFQAGAGLGKNAQGIAVPVQAEIRPKLLGLGAR